MSGGQTEQSRDDDVVPVLPVISSLGQAVARRRMRAALLGETTPPVRVDRFGLERELGRGGMGTVWLAHDVQLGRQVALKFLHETGEGEQGEQRLLAEAQSLAKLSHPNVTPVFDVGRHEGRVWLAMEFVPGQTLRQWVSTEHPSARQRLDAWIEAGRGLAAVHEAGLVHRDIKPDNVLRGDDGRVRLIDFGLVRREGSTIVQGEMLGTIPSGDEGSAHSMPEQPRGPSQPLTRTGQFLGTPAYAAPEQRFGAAVDARADQFSLCVSLWESLCGERPTLRSLPSRPGELLPVPAGVRLSGRLRRALSRGLCEQPQARFESMDALLAAIEPRRGRTVVAAIVGTGALMGVAGLALGLQAAPSGLATEPCADTGQMLDDRWTDARRRALGTLGNGAGEAAREAIDDFAERWRSAAQRSCEEVQVEHTRSPRSLDVRRACLEAQLDRLEVVLAALEHGGEGVATSVSEWVAALDDPRTCLAPALLEGKEQPVTEQTAVALSELRTELFAVLLGADEPSLETRRTAAGELRERARALAHLGTEGRVVMAQGELASRAGDAVAARTHFGEALDLGTTLGDTALIVDAWLGLSVVALELDVDLQGSDWALGRAKQVLAALGEPDRPMARALLQRSRWHSMRGEPEQAEALARRSVAVLEQAGPTARWLLAAALRSLANVLATNGRADEALALHERARGLEVLGGADEPKTGRASPGEAFLGEGMAQLAAGKLDDAARTVERARVAMLRERGPRSLDVATTHVTLAALHDAKGDVAQARAHALEADRILRDAHGAAHPDRVHALSALGTVEFRQDRFSEAALVYQRALDLAELQPETLRSDLAMHRANLGEALLRSGDLPRARQSLTRAVADLEATLGPGDPHAAIPSKALGETLLAQGEAAAALPRLEHALELLERSGKSPLEHAETQWAIARALLANDAPAKALDAARRAADEFSALGPQWAERTTTIRTWIDTNDEE